MREIAIKEAKINELIMRRRPGLLSKCPPRRNVNKKRLRVWSEGSISKIHSRDELVQKRDGQLEKRSFDPFDIHERHAQSNKGIGVGVIILCNLRSSSRRLGSAQKEKEGEEGRVRERRRRQCWGSKAPSRPRSCLGYGVTGSRLTQSRYQRVSSFLLFPALCCRDAAGDFSHT